MKPPRIRFPREDYQSLTGDTLDKFLRNLTALADFTTRLGDGGVTFDNLRGFVKTLTFTAKDGWKTPTFTNGWGQYDAALYPVGYRYEQGGIRLRGLVSGGTLNAAAFSVPVPPTSTQVFDARCASGAAKVDVWASGGGVNIAGNNEYTGNPATWTSLGGIFVPVDSVAVPNPAFPLRFRNELGSAPVAVLLLGAQDVTDSTPRAVSLGNPAWQTSKEDLLITDIHGVTAGKKFSVKILVLGG